MFLYTITVVENNLNWVACCIDFCYAQVSFLYFVIGIVLYIGIKFY